MKTFLEKVCVVSTGRRFHILKCLFQLRVRSITLRSGSKKAFFFCFLRDTILEVQWI